MVYDHQSWADERAKRERETEEVITSGYIRNFVSWKQFHLETKKEKYFDVNPFMLQQSGPPAL